MKKLMVLLAVFAGISMLSAAELSADGWIKSQMQGKFVFTNPGKYPISMKCDEPSAGKAVKEVGISRSTYYKYKDYILEPSEMAGGRKAVLSLMLSHEPGVLSAVLARISEQGGSVLTITQSLPIRGKASVTITLDISGMEGPLTGLMEALSATPGAENPRLVAVD